MKWLLFLRCSNELNFDLKTFFRSVQFAKLNGPENEKLHVCRKFISGGLKPA